MVIKMKKSSWKERTTTKLLRAGRKNRWLKYPSFAAVFVLLCFFRIIEYFAGNGKKYASIAVLSLAFMMSSSFASPYLATEEDAAVYTAFAQKMTGQEETEAAQQVKENPESNAEVELLDDSDVLDGYEDANLDNLEDVDKYTLDEILEENKQIESVDMGETTESTEQAEKPVFDKSDWRLVLINKQHPIPEDYEFTLGTIKGAMKCDERILEDLLAMLQAAKNDGVNLVICSPYRDLNRQEVLFDRKIKNYMSRGMGYMDAYKLASQAVTVPGASEHQIGLALDIVCDYYSLLNEGFGETEAGKWLAEHSCEYGFILRYPKGKEYITSIEYEPWHFRYVGREAAQVITEQNMTLEEFVENL